MNAFLQVCRNEEMVIAFDDHSLIQYHLAGFVATL